MKRRRVWILEIKHVAWMSLSPLYQPLAYVFAHERYLKGVLDDENLPILDYRYYWLT